MARPMFFYAGVYDSATDAETDLDAIKRLNDTKEIGSYDSAIVVKEADGNVRVTKTEKPVEHGAWIGAAAGAAVGLIFPPLIPVTAAAGAGVGAWIGHLAHGTSRGELKRVGASLNEGDAAVVVIGVDNDADKVKGAATHARDHSLQRNVGDWDDAEQDALTAVKHEETAGAPA